MGMSDMTTRPTDIDSDGTPDATTPATRDPTTDPGGDDAADTLDDDTWSSTGRKIAFRIFSVLVALLMVLAFVLSFAVLEVVVMWLPADTLLEVVGEGETPGGLLVHRSHFMAVGLVAWTIVPAVLVQLRQPWRRVAPMLVAVVMAIAAAIVFGLAGTLAAWLSEDLVLTIPILVLAALHPRARDLVRRPGFDHEMLRWALVAAAPWAVYALAQARLQFLDRPGDVHAGIEHWGSAFLLAVAAITCAVLGASDHDGWRLPAWTAVAVSVLFGVHSLVFPGLASGLPLIAALGAIAWAGVYGLALVRRSRPARASAGA